jgi:DNA-binding protein Fis
MTPKEQNTSTKNGKAQKPKSLLALKVEMLSELVASVQDEINSLSVYLRIHGISTQNDSFDLSWGINLAEEMRRIEIELITYVLRYTRGHQVRAARILGVKPTTLNAKIKVLGISPLALREPSFETLTNGKPECDTFPLGPQRTPNEASADANTF